MTAGHWIGVDGWPCSFAESSIGSGLMEAVYSIPGGGELDAATCERIARLLYSASCSGRDQELPRNRPASPEATEKELRELHKLAGKLAAHIEAMRAPAIAALYHEGAYVFDVIEPLLQIQEYARHALREAMDIAEERSPRGAPSKQEAAEVTRTASGIFERVTGQVPTFTSDPDTGEVRGPWPDFLAAVFVALGVDASVSAQSRQLRKIKSRKFSD